ALDQQARAHRYGRTRGRPEPCPGKSPGRAHGGAACRHRATADGRSGDPADPFRLVAGLARDAERKESARPAWAAALRPEIGPRPAAPRPAIHPDRWDQLVREGAVTPSWLAEDFNAGRRQALVAAQLIELASKSTDAAIAMFCRLIARLFTKS